MLKRVVLTIAVAGLSVGALGQGAYADHGEYCDPEQRASDIQRPLEPAGAGNIGVGLSADEGFSGVYDDDSGVYVEVFLNDGGATVEADTAQGVTYCSDGTRDGITDLLP
jgi:hypothetical protein